MSDTVQEKITESMTNDAPNRRSASIRRFLPLAIIGAALAGFFFLDLGQYLSLDALRDNRAWLLDQVATNHALAAIAFMAAYAIAVAVCIPGATLFTLLSGFLFGAVLGSVYAVVGATIGAIIIFLATKTALADVLRDKAGSAVAKMQDGFKENELSYMFFLRLVPAFPFFVVNIVPGLLNVSLRNYSIATLIGIIPGGAIYAAFGAGLGEIIDSGAELSLEGVVSPELIAGLVGLAVLSLVPVVVKKIKGRPKA